MPIIKTCPVCGKEFKTYSCYVKQGKGVYCSKSCKSKDEFKEKRNKLIGTKIGRWTILEFTKTEENKTYCLCQCECGNTKELLLCNIKKTQSCGCIKNTRNGLSHSRLFKIYSHMVDRCYNPKNNRYGSYGKRGIKVCQEWLDDFMNFYNWANNNGYKDTLTIERIDVNKDYCPENCKWITKSEQAWNRTNNVRVTINDETHCLAEWCRIYKLPYSVVSKRIHIKKWNIGKALMLPKNYKN